MKINWFICLITVCSCVALKSAAQQQTPKVIGVASVDGENQIDCKTMLSDEGLPRLIPLLESQQMKTIGSKDALPPRFITFINSLFNSPYKFADCEEEWEVECISFGGARELFVYAGLSESLFALSFQTSDMGYSVNHVYLIRYDGDTILELWRGSKYTDGGEWRIAELNTQARLLAWLNRHKDQSRALHCYNYYGCDY